MTKEEIQKKIGEILEPIFDDSFNNDGSPISEDDKALVISNLTSLITKSNEEVQKKLEKKLDNADTGCWCDDALLGIDTLIREVMRAIGDDYQKNKQKPKKTVQIHDEEDWNNTRVVDICLKGKK